MRRRALASRAIPRALILAIVVSAAMSTGLLPFPRASPVEAGTAASMQSALVGWINDARTARGLAPLRVDGRLAAVASERVATLAAIDQLSHTAAGCLDCQLAARGIAWNLNGEVLASNSWPWGLEAARTAFDGWKGSPTHLTILMGSQMDTVGIGVALTSNGVSYVAAILIDASGSTPAAPQPKPVPATPVKTPAPTPTATPQPIVVPGPNSGAFFVPE